MNLKLETHSIPGHQTIYVECQCGEHERETLFEELRKSASDAIKLQLHDDQQGIDNSNVCELKIYYSNVLNQSFQGSKKSIKTTVL
jgi:hypothetical protein